MGKPKIEQPTIPANVRRDLERAIVKRAKAKALETEAKELSNQAKDVILPILAAYEVSGYVLPGVGKVSQRFRKGVSLNERKLREELLIRDIHIDVINEAIAEASTPWETEYVEFKEDR